MVTLWRDYNKCRISDIQPNTNDNDHWYTFGLQTLKLAILALWPFGSRVVDEGNSGGCLSLIMNIIWIFVGGFWICLTHLGFGLLLCITIIGIPFGMQHFKMAALALAPFGKSIQ